MAQSITEAVIEDIKLRTDLVELISSYGVEVRHSGSSVVACCPFHNEKSPSFHINASKGFYHCFGCGESGDAIKFVQKQEGLTFVEAVKKLGNLCGVVIEERADPEAGKRKRLHALMAELAQFYHRCLLKTKEASLAREYLQKRKLDDSVVEDFLVGYAPNGAATILKWAEKYGFSREELEAAGVVLLPRRPGESGYHRFGSRLMFTVFDRNSRAVAFSGRQLVENKNSGKYVNSPETLIFKKSNVLFGFDKAAPVIAKKREVILCEGQIDVIRLHMCGFRNAVASLGTAFTSEQAKMLKRVADSAVLMYDDDAAGRKAAIATARKLLQLDMPVRVVTLPDGTDPDSFLSANPPSALQELVDAAESIVAFQFRAEKAKENQPGGVVAVNRIATEILGTISLSASAILRAAFVDEAARLLSLPVVALTEELEKLCKAPQHAPARESSVPEAFDEGAYGEVLSSEEEFADGCVSGAGQSASSPKPPDREFALMEFLMSHEYDAQVDSFVGGFLPDRVLLSEFTREFVAIWREEAAKGTDMFADFAAGLQPSRREWFDRILLNAGRVEASSLDKMEILSDFVRLLWVDCLKRERSTLAYGGDAQTDARRMRISMDLKRLMTLDWASAGDLITEMMKGES